MLIYQAILSDEHYLDQKLQKEQLFEAVRKELAGGIFS
jgi:shikimate 5-dehydrogenase